MPTPRRPPTRPAPAGPATVSPPTLPFVAPRDLAFEREVIADEAGDVERRDGVVLFWGGYPSQWYPSQFTIDRVTYSCAEQYMMCEKARLFGDAVAFRKILGSKYPRSMKELGRKVRPFREAAWAAVARHAVYRANLAKFVQNPELRALLLATGYDVIGEASPDDMLWGIGKGRGARGAWDRSTWKGRNLLGEAVMHVREVLRTSAPGRPRVTGATLDPVLVVFDALKALPPAKLRR